MQREALNVDAPVTLDELIDSNARDSLITAAYDFGLKLSIMDRDGRRLAGEPMPPAVESTPTEPEATLVPVDGFMYFVTELQHEADAIGRLMVGAFPEGTDIDQARRLVEHLHRIADAFMLEGIKRAMSARMHMATVEEANRELTEKNRRLAQAVERLQEADRIKSNFLATVSHELRTPLTSVIGYSEMLLEGIAGPLNDEQREYVTTVMEKGDQLLQLITGILDISRMEANEMQFHKTAFELDEVVQVALSTIAPHTIRKKMQLSCEIAPDLAKILGDKDKVRQVILNLLNNAVKFTPDGGRIEITAVNGPMEKPSGQVPHGPEGIRLCVKDSGIGIAKEHHEKIFNPFYQVDNTSTREFGGTGLGLNIVKRFVEGHGGHVWVESEEGKGASFFITLPVAP